MTEVLNTQLEDEIATLTREIALKRHELEEKKGIVVEGVLEGAHREREIVHAVLAEKLQSSPTPDPAASSYTPAPSPLAAKPASTGTSYLDSLDAETATRVNALIERAFSKGIMKAIAHVQGESSLVQDAFHDALADRLYDEMKARKMVK